MHSDFLLHEVKLTIPNREVRFPNIQVVVVITTIHYTQVKPEVKAMPIMIIPRQDADSEAARLFVDSLIERWSAFEKRPLIKVDEGLGLKGFKTFDAQKGRKRRDL